MAQELSRPERGPTLHLLSHSNLRRVLVEGQTRRGLLWGVLPRTRRRREHRVRPPRARVEFALQTVTRLCCLLLLVACSLARAGRSIAQPADLAGTATPDAATSAELPSVAPLPQGFVGDPWADDHAPMTLGPWSLRVLLQTRYQQTFAAPSNASRSGYALREDSLAHDGDGLSLQRFFVRIAVVPADYVSFKSIVDLSKLRGADLSNVLKQAYMLLRPWPKRVELVTGVFKLPYSILELDPVARFELPSLGQADELVKNLGFAGRDVGLELMIAPLRRPRWLRAQVGLFQGHARDEHASPLGALGARVESKPLKGLRLGIDLVVMPRAVTYAQPFDSSSQDVLPDPPDPLFPRQQRWGRGIAYSADVSYTRKRFSLRVEGMLGDRVDVDARYGARSFACVWALLAYRFRLDPLGLLPAVRAEWLDTDREHQLGGHLELSVALNLLYKKRLRLVVAAARTYVQPSSPVIEQPRPLPYDPYLEQSRTQVITQLQLEL